MLFKLNKPIHMNAFVSRSASQSFTFVSAALARSDGDMGSAGELAGRGRGHTGKDRPQQRGAN